jgi:hypothetical protein
MLYTTQLPLLLLLLHVGLPATHSPCLQGGPAPLPPTAAAPVPPGPAGRE